MPLVLIIIELEVGMETKLYGTFCHGATVTSTNEAMHESVNFGEIQMEEE
jgi:hypothetical protein